MPPADPASRAGGTPEASGDWSSGTFGKETKLSITNSLAMWPTLIIAGCLWCNSLLLIVVFAFALWNRAIDPFSGHASLITLTLGFSLYMPIRMTRKYRQGIPFNQENGSSL